MNRPKTVQIPVDTFMDLCKVHLLGVDDKDTLEGIKEALEGKLDAMVRHEAYTAYKVADTPEEREAARLEYLERVGMAEGFRH